MRHISKAFLSAAFIAGSAFLVPAVSYATSVSGMDYKQGHRPHSHRHAPKPQKVNIFIQDHDNPQLAKRLRVLLRQNDRADAFRFVEDRQRADVIYNMDIRISRPALRDHDSKLKSKKYKSRGKFDRRYNGLVKAHYQEHKEKWSLRYSANLALREDRGRPERLKLAGRIDDRYAYADGFRFMAYHGWVDNAPLPNASLEHLAANGQDHMKNRFFEQMEHQALVELAAQINMLSQQRYDRAADEDHHRGAPRPEKAWRFR